MLTNPRHYIVYTGKPPASMPDDYLQQIQYPLVYVTDIGSGIVVGLVVLIENLTPVPLDYFAAKPRRVYLYTITLCYRKSCSANRRYTIQLYTNELMHENLDYYAHRGQPLTGEIHEKDYNSVYMRKESD